MPAGIEPHPCQRRQRLRAHCDARGLAYMPVGIVGGESGSAASLMDIIMGRIQY